MPLVSASKEICNLIYIMVQVITHFHPSNDSVVVRVIDSHAAAPGYLRLRQWNSFKNCEISFYK